MITESLDLATAWERAWKDPVAKERNFSTPLSVYAKRRPDAAGADASRCRGTGGQEERQEGKGKAVKILRGHAQTRWGSNLLPLQLRGGM